MLRWLKTVVVSDEEKAHMMRQVGMLTVVEPAVEDIVEGADGNRRLGRQGDGLVGDVTVVSLAWCRVRRHGDGRLRAWQGPAGPNFSCEAGAEGPGAARGRRIRSMTTPGR